MAWLSRCLNRLPKAVLFGLCGMIAGSLGAALLGEPIWAWLRPPPPPASATPPELEVTASPHISLYQGGRNRCQVRLFRNRLSGPATVGLADLPRGVSAPTITMGPDKNEGEIEIFADL